MDVIETDYLVVGAGLAGMGFVDSLLDVSDADIVMLDRRHAPGGHWLDSYPFVRLHQPTPWYGVGSTPNDDDRLEIGGPEDGSYGRASGVELRDYFANVMRDRFLPSGRVRFFPMTDYAGRGRFRSVFGGAETEVRVRRKVVDATYMPSESPESFAPPFDVGDGTPLVTPTGLTKLTDAAGAVVIGAGKTATDTCVWLLEQGCPPENITWVRSRDAWFLNRYFMQPNRLAAQTIDGTARFVEAIAGCDSIDAAFERLESDDYVRRIDREVTPTVFRGAVLSDYEIELLRGIHHVVRGRVRSVASGRMVLESGDGTDEVAVAPGRVFVHCAAPGLARKPLIPVFDGDRITVQYLTRASLSLSSAAIARIETLAYDDDAKNALCPPRYLPTTPLEYAQMILGGLTAEVGWAGEPVLAEWMNATRVNVTRDAMSDPATQALYGRLFEAFGPASERLATYLAA